MAVEPGTYALDPKDGTLSVRTGRRGAIAKVGHDLLIQVDRWGATVTLGEQTVLELTADSTSMRVVQGSGGVKPLSDDEKSGIEQTINEDVLKGTPISFRSTSVQTADDGRLHVQGDLELANGTNPVTFELTIGDDGHLSATAVLKQSDFGMKPYTTLFGTLKVADEVEVSIDGRLSAEAVTQSL